MAATSKSDDDDARPTSHGTAFKNMTSSGKFVWLLKLTICICAFGFLFPDVMNA